LIGELGAPWFGCPLVMDMAYEGNETLGLASFLGFRPIVPPHPLRRAPWRLNRRLYRQRNRIERLFRRLKGFRRVSTRYDKLDVLFQSFVYVALCWILLNSVNRP
jgi:transposase